MPLCEFSLIDPDTLQPMEGRSMTLNRVGIHNAVGNEGPVQVPMFDESGMKWMGANIKNAIDLEFDCPVITTGKRRRGKSNFTIKLFREHVWPGFSLENIHFEVDSYVSSLQGCDPANPSIGYYPVQMYDESITGFHNQDWQHQIPYVKVLNIVGKKRICMPFLLPNLGDLNSKVKPLVMFWVYLYRRGVAEIRVPSENQFDGSVFWRPYCAISFDKLDGPFWDAYEVKKMEFIERYDAVNTDVRGRRSAEAMQRDALISHVVEQGWMKADDIAVELDVKPGTVKSWMTRYRQKMESVSQAVV